MEIRPSRQLDHVPIGLDDCEAQHVQAAVADELEPKADDIARAHRLWIRSASLPVTGRATMWR
jgi:hypothetical protein